MAQISEPIFGTMGVYLRLLGGQIIYKEIEKGWGQDTSLFHPSVNCNLVQQFACCR